MLGLTWRFVGALVEASLEVAMKLSCHLWPQKRPLGGSGGA